VRERDSMRQVRVPIEGVVNYLTDCLNRGELVDLTG
jgi:glycyl-tRNA synthetase (class II)